MKLAQEERLRQLRVFAFDLDGTLLDRQGRVSEETRKALHLLHQRGMKLLAATGRTLPEAWEVCRGIPFDGYVCSNGMTVFDHDRLPLRVEALEGDAVLGLIRYFRRRKYNFELHDILGRVIMVEEDRKYLAQRVSNTTWLPVDDLTYAVHAGKLRIVKLLLWKQEVALFHDDLVRMQLPLQLITMGNTSMEISKPGIDKWTGVCVHLDRWGLVAEQTAAFGDSMNDRELLIECGWSVAMGNAGEQVKAFADDVTSTNEDNGVAQYIMQLLKHIETGGVAV